MRHAAEIKFAISPLAIHLGFTLHLLGMTDTGMRPAVDRFLWRCCALAEVVGASRVERGTGEAFPVRVLPDPTEAGMIMAENANPAPGNPFQERVSAERREGPLSSICVDCRDHPAFVTG
jgi:hypothetical protein